MTVPSRLRGQRPVRSGRPDPALHPDANHLLMLPGPGDLHKVKPSQAGWRAGLKKKCGAARRTSLVQRKWTALVSVTVVLSGCSVSEFIFPRNNVIRWLISLSPSPKLVGVFLWPRTEIWEGQRQKSRSSRMHSWQRAGRWAQRPPRGRQARPWGILTGSSSFTVPPRLTLFSVCLFLPLLPS